MARWAPAALTDYFAATGSRSSPALGGDTESGGRDAEVVGDNVYLKGCHWAPDGSCIAVNAADHCLRIFNTPATVLEEGRADENEPLRSGDAGALPMTPEELDAARPPWLPVLTMPEGELIYDYAWYPRMSSEEPATCRLFSSSRDHPVHAWDAFTGELAATYRNYDQFDAVTACHSLALAVDGHTLICGLQSCVHIFDVARPGRHYQRRSTCRRRQGCKGFIASLTMSSDGGQYLCGGYSGQAALFCLRSGDLVAEVRAPTAVTHAVFANEDTSLVLGLRANPQLLHYDTRRMDRPVHVFHRRLCTNQRLQLAVSPSGRYLLSGDQEGSLLTFDLWAGRNEGLEAGHGVTDPVASQHMHNACLNGVDWHPFLPVVAVATGQRHIPFPGSPPTSPCSPAEGESQDGAWEDGSNGSNGSNGNENFLALWQTQDSHLL